jgi:hypothetical protein
MDMRTEVLDWNSFMSGEVKVKVHPKQVAGIVVKSLVGGHLFFIPTNALAAGAAGASSAASWAKIFAALMLMADWTAGGVIMFCGAMWMFGHRTKAIEGLISGAIGYIIIRHAMDIRDWLKGI